MENTNEVVTFLECCVGEIVFCRRRERERCVCVCVRERESCVASGSL